MAATKKKVATKPSTKAAKASTKPTAKTTKVKTVVARKSVPAKTESSSFWKIEFNVTTLFWLAIGVAVIATAAWTYNSSQQISEIYDSIDETNLQTQNITIPKKESPAQ